MERRDSSLFPTLLSLFPSSFRLAQHSQSLANVTLYGEHLGCCWGAHPQQQFFGGRATRLADEGKG